MYGSWTVFRRCSNTGVRKPAPSKSTLVAEHRSFSQDLDGKSREVVVTRLSSQRTLSVGCTVGGIVNVLAEKDLVIGLHVSVLALLLPTVNEISWLRTPLVHNVLWLLCRSRLSWTVYAYKKSGLGRIFARRAPF